MPVKDREEGGSVIAQGHPLMGWTWSRTARSIGERIRLRLLIEIVVLERTEAKPFRSVKARARLVLDR